MTNYYKPITWSTKHRDLDWINCMVSVHDLRCSCDDPLKHIIIGIIEKEPSIKFNKEDSTKLLKCLTTGDPGTGDVVDDFGDGELEKLFEGDLEEDDDR